MKPITRKIVDDFQVRFAKLESLLPIESISLTVESHLEQIRNSIENYIESQRLVLERASDMVSKHPQDLKDNIEGIQTALKGIECLAQFGGESLKERAKKIMDETLRQM